MPHLIGFFLTPGFQMLDLAGPLATFQEAEAAAPGSYRTVVLSARGGLTQSEAGPPVWTERLIAVEALDTLIVVGGRGPREAAQDPRIVNVVNKLADKSDRVASVCTGAFLLAATGRLDNRRATTHWRFSAELQRRYPAIRVQPDCIYIQDGPVWSSAGITAGIDLALAMIESELGDAAARAVAHDLVVQSRRLGGQAQFSAMLALEPRTDRLRKAWMFAREHLGEALPVERLAAAAALSSRQFARIFQMETGQTPAKAVELLRVEAARARLDRGIETLKNVSSAVGFTSIEQMRRAFIRTMGRTPQTIKREAQIHRRPIV